MQNVTDEVSNPFGMRPPCPHPCDGGDGRRAVMGFGDANADVHVIGDHPGVHGGADTGVPFTGHPAGERVLDVLEATGFLDGRDGPEPALDDCYLSYRHCCCVPPGGTPTPEQYRDFERFFDAELRAVAADVLVPVGEGATRQVVETYTAKAHQLGDAMAELHATEIRGRGFLVLPMREPADWAVGDFEAMVDAVERLLATDYRQLVDLGRFTADADPYFVR
ncbi:MAG: uracil-DNA glycosylase family protein [Halobacteriales archaeon]|nr:uracil-DNA glycosylase family protein [Halobacteriales archaeon]